MRHYWLKSSFLFSNYTKDFVIFCNFKSPTFNSVQHLRAACLAELLEDVSSRRTVQMATEHVLIALKLTEILKPLDLQSKVTPPLYCASEYNGCTSKPVRSGSLRLGLTTWSLTQNILRTSRTGHWVRSLMWRIPTVHLVRSCEPRQISPSVSPESSLSLLTSLR